MSEAVENIPAKKMKPDGEFSKKGFYEFPSDRIASIVYNSFAHDEDTPRSKAEKHLEVLNNKIHFSITARDEKSLNKTLEGMNEVIGLSRRVLSAGGQFGGLNEEEKSGLIGNLSLQFE